MTGLSFVYAAGPCQRNLSRVRVPCLIFYCLRFEISLFVASYNSEGHGWGPPPRRCTPYAPQTVRNVQHKVHETNPLPLEAYQTASAVKRTNQLASSGKSAGAGSQTASALLCNSVLTGCSGSIGSPSQNVPLLLSVLLYPVFWMRVLLALLLLLSVWMLDSCRMNGSPVAGVLYSSR
jgi:hypothetical protein